MDTPSLPPEAPQVPAHSAEYVLPSTPPPRHHGVLIAIIVLVLLILGGGGAAYAAMQGWIQLPFGLLAPQPPTYDQIEARFKEVNSGIVTLKLNAEVQPLQEGTVVIPLSPEVEPKHAEDSDVRMGQPNEESRRLRAEMIAKQIPSDAKLSLETRSNVQKGEQVDVDGGVKATYQSSGMSLTFDVAFRSVQKEFYLQLNSFPIPIVDFAALTGTWVQLNEKSFSGISLLGGATDPEAQVWEYDTSDLISASTTTAEPKKTPAERHKAFMDEWTVLDEELKAKNAFTMDRITHVTNEQGRRVWRAALQMHPEAMRDAIVAAVARRPAAETPVLLTDAFKASAEDEEFIPWLTAITQALTTELDVDQETLLPVRQTFHLRFRTQGDVWAERNIQYVLDLSVDLSDVNTPITVTAPAEHITLPEAMRRVMHISEEQARFSSQTQIINDLREVLDGYAIEKGTYPSALSELVGFYRNSRRVTQIPNDQYIKQPLIYTRSADGTNYTLVYQIQQANFRSVLLDRYVEGANTATRDFGSVEGMAGEDGDKDGLTDIEEARVGTSSYLDDSDYDGFSDKKEVDGGYDPLYNDKTKAKYRPYRSSGATFERTVYMQEGIEE